MARRAASDDTSAFDKGRTSSLLAVRANLHRGTLLCAIFNHTALEWIDWPEPVEPSAAPVKQHPDVGSPLDRLQLRKSSVACLTRCVLQQLTGPALAPPPG